MQPGFAHSRNIVRATLIAAGLAATAQARDCGLSVSLSQRVVRTGQSVRVDVFAHYPASGFAFASSEFDVLASAPAWNAVSNGVVVGDDVLGVQEFQEHDPFGGHLADPANPLQVWSGTFAPTSHLPALVQFTAAPSDFHYFPSPLTPSSAECDARPGAAHLFVNPLRVGPFGAAPGPGSSIDVVGGSLIAETDPEEALLIGLLLPAVQKVYVGIGPVDGPDELVIETETRPNRPPLQSAPLAPAAEAGELERSSVGFVRAGKHYALEVDAPGEPTLHYRLTLLGKVVAEFNGPEGRAPFVVGRLPNSIEHEVGHLLGLGSVARFDGGMIVVLSDGSVRFIDAIQFAAPSASGPGPHVRVFDGMTIRASGAPVMTFTPRAL